MLLPLSCREDTTVYTSGVLILSTTPRIYWVHFRQQNNQPSFIMASDEETSDSENGTLDSFQESTQDLLRDHGVSYHEDPGTTFGKRKGLHVSLDGGVLVLSVAGSASMIQDYSEDGEDAVRDILQRAADQV